MNILIGLLSWFFFVILYGQISRNMYERKECILGIKISYRIARLLGFSGHTKKISIFVFIYQIIYRCLSI